MASSPPQMRRIPTEQFFDLRNWSADNAEDYVHRIGRTGRANREGDAFTLLSADELDHAKAVETYIDQKIEKRKLDNFNYQYTTLLDEDAPTPEKLAKIFRSKKRGGSRRRRR